jgi:succinate dehydrogenase / fumarate reductase, cytochrome b subunit
MAAPSSPTGPTPMRPLSPHLQVWRWHVTMLASILNRATGIGLYLGALGLVVWLALLAAGPEAYAPVEAALKAWYGQVALFLLAVAAAYHFAAGVRHLVWDSGRGFEPKTADATAWFAILFALLAPIGLWAVAG